MDKIDLSKEDGRELNLQYAKEQYLGGDNDELEGFYESDDEVDFENFKRGNKNKGSNSLFSRLTNAF